MKITFPDPASCDAAMAKVCRKWEARGKEQK